MVSRWKEARPAIRFRLKRPIANCASAHPQRLVMPMPLALPKGDTASYRKSWHASVRCAVIQGGQGDVKHWAFNDPPRRKAI